MDSTVVGALVFAVLFGAGLLGVRVRAMRPEDHLNPDTKDSVKVGILDERAIESFGHSFGALLLPM